MNLLFLIPVVVLVLVVILFLYSRKGGRAGSGMGDRRDSRERPELRGTEQAKHRPEFGGDGPGNRPT